MAGKPSKGCRTCVKRRIKCDETRPECNRCKKSNRSCPGFIPPAVFHQTIFVGDKSERNAQQEESSQDGAASDAVSTHRPALRSLTIFEYSGRIPQSLDLSGFTNNLYSSFLLNTYWSSNSQFRDHEQLNRQWFTQCLSDQDKHPTSNLALQALAMAFFGRKNFQEHIVLHSEAIYGRALRALGNNIQNRINIDSFDTLAAVTALSMFEYVALTTYTGYIRHTQALARIVEHRGPEAFYQYPEKAILQAQRPLIMIQGLGARKRCFLERPEWIAIHEHDVGIAPRTRSSFDKPMGELLNIFSRLPGIFEDVGKIRYQRIHEALGTGMVDLAALEDVTVRLHLFHNSLRGWQARFDEVFEDARSEKRGDGIRITRDAEGPVFQSILWWKCLEAANIWNLYTTIKMLSLEQQYMLDHPTYMYGYARDDLTDDHHWTDKLSQLREMAFTIIRNVEYHLQPLHVNSGAFYILFPSRVAYMALDRSTREAKWLKVVIENMADKGGVELARHILRAVTVQALNAFEGKNDDG
ncbi:MAG: hypothetical protein M1820_009114 [Bogoriella megaspora]|nr:MAG: hypothetical protein M1820_009114 [Bogoriella megaspora]